MINKKAFSKYRSLLFSMLFSFSCCILYLCFTPSQFTASTILTLKKNQQKLNKDAPHFFSAYNPRSQIKSLLSKQNIQQAIIDSNYQAGLFRQNKVINTALDNNSAPVKIRIIRNAIRDKKISLEILNDRQFRLIDDNINTIYDFDQLISTPETAFKVSLNRKVFKNIKINFIIYTLFELTDDYSDHLEVIPVTKDSSKVKVSFTAADSSKAKGFLSQLSKIYKADRVTRANNNQTIGFIDNQLDSIRDDLVKLKNDVEKLKRSGTVRDQPAPLQEEAIEKQINILNRLEPYISAPIDQFSFVPNTFAVNDDSLQLLIEKLNKSQIEKQEILRTEAKGSSRILQADLALQKLKNETIQQLKKQNKILTANIQADFDKTSASARNPLSFNAVLNKIHNQQQAKVKLYLYLLQKREDIKTAMTGPLDFKMQIIISPERKTLPALAIAFLIGLLLPLSFKYWMPNDKFITTGADVEKITNIPVTANLDNYNREEKILLPFEHDSIFGRQLYKACGSLIDLKRRSHQNLVYVNSISAGEGKTFVTNNLSSLLAGLNYKILIITDDSNFDLHIQSNNELRKNLCDFLKSEELHLAATLRITQEPNLFIIKIGNDIDEALSVVKKSRVDLLLLNLKTRFDFIFLDLNSKTARPFFANEIVLTVLRCDHTTFNDVTTYVKTSEIKSKNQLYILDGTSPRFE